MNKSDFLAQLGGQLSGLSQTDLDKSLAYYNEMIDDRIEDGASEEEAVAAVGTPQQAATQILSELPLSKVLKVKMKKSERLPAWATVLLAIGSPIWLSLIIAAFAIILSLAAAALAVVVSVYAALWSVLIALWAVGLAFVLSPLFGIFLLIISIVGGNVGGGIALLGAGFTLGGVSAFYLRFCLQGTKLVAKISKKLFLAILSWFRKKEVK